ncbi:MAG: HipA family kinase [Ferruginibacter sp.]
MTHNSSAIRTVQVMRYVTPLREGGSLPAIAEADDEFLYVVKFRGAGQGTRALVADFIGAELARAAGLKVPELVFANLDEAFGRTEPDEEIQDLLKASVGVNLGVHYLQGAITYDPAVKELDASLSSKIVWLDALLMNVDRTAKNTNMLCWHNENWLIDFGASLYFHHAGYEWETYASKPFVQIRDHVLLKQATEIEQADAALRQIFTYELIHNIVAAVPESWLQYDNEKLSVEEIRKVYTNFLISRIAGSANFVNEIIHGGK